LRKDIDIMLYSSNNVVCALRFWRSPPLLNLAKTNVMPLGSAVSAGVHTSAAVTTDSASAHAIGQAVDGAQGPLVQQTPNFMDMYAPEHYKQKYARNIEDERLVPPGPNPP
jgi:hypothetical protein